MPWPVYLSFTLSQLSFLDRTWDLDLLIYISDVSPLSGQSLLTILLLIVSSFSEPSTYSNLGIFLVCLTIVLLLRKVPIGLVYKSIHVSLFPLASSVLYLLSNLVSSLGLPVWLKPHKLLVTRSPFKKTSLDLLLDLGLTNLSSLCHCPKDTDRNSMCPHTTPECALLEIRLHRPCNKSVQRQTDWSGLVEKVGASPCPGESRC